MKISVIVPVYGVEQYIVKCVDSLVNQTFKEIEILLVNDGTKDRSIDLINENFKDERINILTKENGGVASARNFGIKHATGEYLLFVDPDDFIDKNMLKDMYDTLIREQTDLVICDYYKCFPNGKKEAVSLIPFYDSNNSKCSVISMPGAVCKLFKKELFKKYDIQFLEGKHFEDNAIMPFACALAQNFSYIQKPYYFYLQRDGSILNKTVYDVKWEDIYESLQYLYDQFRINDMLNEFHDEVEYVYIEYLLHAANLRFISYEEGKHNVLKTKNVIKNKFPKWRKNKYYLQSSFKYKVMCNLMYYNKLGLIKILRRN